MLSRCLLGIFGLIFFLNAGASECLAYKPVTKMDTQTQWPYQDPGSEFKFDVPMDPFDTSFWPKTQVPMDPLDPSNWPKTQVPGDLLNPSNEYLKKLLEYINQAKEKKSQSEKPASSPSVKDMPPVEVLIEAPDLKESYTELMKERLKLAKAEAQYRSKVFEKMSENVDSQLSIRKGAFRLQQFFGWASLVVVHLLLIIGIFAFIKESKEASKLRASGLSNEELQISMAGIAVKSSFQSLIILAITLAFYFLYLRFVFPISEL
ncbi:hypothetical protein [uncultured Desulfosarcina sp.]|uniref:hypothetical protein n=1 Tax=uncultured Desulfosarcina sp. TaxID=218289 RepID=UPI0029C6D110|nr:hypothetical protein [uncultured Desulfosarcina sp.]